MILKSESCHPVRWMRILMKNTEALASERIDDFLQATAEIDFAGQGRRGVYEWVTATLVEQEYFTLRKKQRGKVRALLSKSLEFLACIAPRDRACALLKAARRVRSFEDGPLLWPTRVEKALLPDGRHTIGGRS